MVQSNILYKQMSICSTCLDYFTYRTVPPVFTDNTEHVRVFCSNHPFFKGCLCNCFFFTVVEEKPRETKVVRVIGVKPTQTEITTVEERGEPIFTKVTTVIGKKKPTVTERVVEGDTKVTRVIGVKPSTITKVTRVIGGKFKILILRKSYLKKLDGRISDFTKASTYQHILFDAGRQFDADGKELTG